MWHCEHSVETSASPEAIWQLFRDVGGWKAWNSGIEEISIAGPFVEGTQFLMKPPGQDAFTSQLICVLENERFDDETVVGDVRVVVEHRIQALAPGRTRITYAASVEGPDAEEIGAAVTGDFPDVLAALAKLAESRTG